MREISNWWINKRPKKCGKLKLNQVLMASFLHFLCFSFDRQTEIKTLCLDHNKEKSVIKTKSLMKGRIRPSLSTTHVKIFSRDQDSRGVFFDGIMLDCSFLCMVPDERAPKNNKSWQQRRSSWWSRTRDEKIDIFSSRKAIY